MPSPGTLDDGRTHRQNPQWHGWRIPGEGR